MTVYAALLRGINVGGHNKIKMAELREILEAAGCKQVQTYIQSGNVVLTSDLDAPSLQRLIETEIQNAFGLNIPVVIRSSSDFEAIMRQCPYDEAGLQEGESIHVSMLSGIPQEAGLHRLAATERGDDEYQIIGSDVHLLFRKSIRDSKLAVNLAKLGIPGTVRNWNTMKKLSDMISKTES
ncbi:DUF1697 domain-containing protein [Paenibacillus sp. HJL G12]|uniref:DUF1697 domain-containing protein n=1 Tax=Paenibacillus dendrobii TaxID=2691084 RepID=A0A7X3IEB8_9BACL|nr:DUF1697 domain-containing protein [Paenibacillus dendrobii]MWV42342.1 DUF1697 domain-containing protein [Paenibacillus dendrobii]